MPRRRDDLNQRSLQIQRTALFPVWRKLNDSRRTSDARPGRRPRIAPTRGPL